MKPSAPGGLTSARVDQLRCSWKSKKRMYVRRVGKWAAGFVFGEHVAKQRGLTVTCTRVRRDEP